ncbi:unnamed protein product [Triticum turgidum subsp. durum]|uniref:Protein kinase G11A n=1 Tax=Triticum turgidum subsp. durum TaxID=4567 RepID=A0A9R1BXZ1_TRITD|nr:unnamed protein product [Triticum turgidum subsp. durum]
MDLSDLECTSVVSVVRAMTSKTMPQTIPTTPNTEEKKQYSPNDSPLDLTSLSKPSTALPRKLPESAIPSSPNKEVQSNDQKPSHKLHESVDVTSSKVPADDEKDTVENGNTNGNVKSDSAVDKDHGAASASGSARLTGRSETGERGISSRCRPSTGSDVSEESACSSFSSTSKPHKANDSRWEAIQMIRTRDGILGLSHFKLLKKLGCGDIGSVYLSELTGTKSYFAMKVMDKASLTGRKKLLRAQTEKEILQCLDHPFLPTLYTHFETDKFSCLVMEFCPGGDLHTLRQKQRGKYFPEQAVKFYVAEILLAMEYLHMLGIIYRDLKPENILVRDDGHIMLSDFDLSLRCTPSCTAPTTCFGPRFFSKSKKDRKPKPEVVNQVRPWPELMAEPSDARSMSFVGTHEYLAPEIIKGEGHGSAVDWWTFGIFLYELLFGKTPFKGSGNRATLFNVIGQPLRFPEYPVVSFSARDLIRGLLVKEPQQRLGCKRGATEIKQHPFFEGVNWALIRCASPPEVPKPVEIERQTTKLPVSTSEASAAPTGASQKGSDNYLEFDFF